LRNELHQGSKEVGEGEQPPPLSLAHARMPAAAQAVPQVVPLIGQFTVVGDLFERFRMMRAPVFEGSTDPLVADEWMSKINTIFNFMNIQSIRWSYVCPLS